VDKIEDHKIHSESYEISAQTIKALRTPKNRLRIAVGTTSVRTIESIITKLNDEDFDIKDDDPAISAETNIYIYPPAEFKAVDALITNFHLPKSSLLCLVASFLEPEGTSGIKTLKKLYNEAIRNHYRFYSYGDALLIL
jgi:S-adenosylmethionine:tRNA ribosyltransferase-isomerase